jgi:hypothetical protein
MRLFAIGFPALFAAAIRPDDTDAAFVDTQGPVLPGIPGPVGCSREGVIGLMVIIGHFRFKAGIVVGIEGRIGLARFGGQFPLIDHAARFATTIGTNDTDTVTVAAK